MCVKITIDKENIQKHKNTFIICLYLSPINNYIVDLFYDFFIENFIKTKTNLEKTMGLLLITSLAWAESITFVNLFVHS